MRKAEELTAALRGSLSGVDLSPFAARRMTETIADHDAGRRLIPAWLVGMGVALATVLWPMTAASEMLF